VPIYLAERSGLLQPLAARLRRDFGLAIEEHPPAFDPELAFEPARGQYNSRILLAQLLRDAHGGAARVLGVTGVDLFIPVLTFVLGEAQLDGRAAVVSTHRLDNQLYGLPADADLLFERLVKEAVHELGHTHGLVHCHVGGCVMLSSAGVEEVDLKSDRFCDRCMRQLRQAISGGDRRSGAAGGG
jgi:archaemetzincin